MANLKEAVSINTPNVAQQKLKVQLQSVAKSLEALAIAQQNNTPNVAAYSMYPRLPTPGRQDNSNNIGNTHHYQQQHRQHASDLGRLYNSNDIAKLVQDEVRRQTRFVAHTNWPSNTGVPSSRNRRTTDGIPICNKCNKVGHIARNCRSVEEQVPPMPRQFPPRQPPNVNLRPDAPPFAQQRASNPFRQQSGN